MLEKSENGKEEEKSQNNKVLNTSRFRKMFIYTLWNRVRTSYEKETEGEGTKEQLSGNRLVPIAHVPALFTH